MDNLFSVDGKLSSFLSRLVDLTLLNFLWLVCCIPIITIGASTTALHSVTLKMVRNEDSYLTRGFFKAFKENFKQATIIWLGILAAGAILYCDFYFAAQINSIVLWVPFLLSSFLVAIASCYVFPVIAFFKNSTGQHLKNAILMALAHLPYTILIVIITAAPVIIFYFANIFPTLFADMLLGVALASWANAHFFNKIFVKYITNDEQKNTPGEL